MRAVAWGSIVIGVLLAAVGVAGLVLENEEEPAPAATTSAASTTTTAVEAEPTTTTTTVEDAVRVFVPQLVAAIRAGDNTFKFERLHPAVLARYGEQTCRAGLSAAQPAFVMDIVSVGPRESWDWVTDGLTTAIPDTVPVKVKRSDANGALVDGVIHVVEAEGEMRWFTDCGTPPSS